MRRPTGAQIEAARRVFALEAHEAARPDDAALAAGRIYEKLFAALAPLVGAAGARALLARGVKLAAVDFLALTRFATDPKSGDSERLVGCLRAERPAAIEQATVALCAATLSLLETLIGERLTANVVRSAWPAFDATHQETT